MSSVVATATGSNPDGTITGAIGASGVPGAQSGGTGEAATNSVDATTPTVSGNTIAVNATAGAGGSALAGGGGANGVMTISQTGTNETITTGSGQLGGTGGTQGDGGIATAMLAGATIGTAISTIGVDAVGGHGGFSQDGNSGGGGGSGGFNGYTQQVNPTQSSPNVSYVGGSGGNGGTGGAGGNGGNAIATVTGDTIMGASGVATELSALADGGYGSGGGTGGYGNSGAGSSNGGFAGGGGNGGSATAVVTGNILTGASSNIELSADAYGGGGGSGGSGGFSGAAVTIDNTAAGFHTTTYTYGNGGNGNNGGNAGSASATISGNTINDAAGNSQSTVGLSAEATSAVPGAGGGGGGAGTSSMSTTPTSSTTTTAGIAGTSGVAGAVGTAAAAITGNIVTLGGANAQLYVGFYLATYLDTKTSLDPAPLSTANVIFSGNVFNGGGTGTLNLGEVTNGAATVDVAHGTLSIAGSPNNIITGFSSFVGTRGTTNFVDGARNQTYSATNVNGTFFPADYVFTAGHGNDTINGFGTQDVIALDGFGAAFQSLAAVQAASKVYYNGSYSGTLISTPDGGSIFLVGVSPTALTAAEFTFSNTGDAPADFNGDGKSDILFQNDDGSINIWEMNGLSISSSGAVANPGPTWHVAATGDFNGDGKSDILFQNNDGTVDIWTMNGTSLTSSGIVADPGPTWHVVGTGDYNGDGKSDILFQNDNGSINLWTVNGQSLVSSGTVANPGSTWQAIGQGGMHFIDGTQSAGSIAGTIQSDNFVFTTSTQGAHVITGFDPLHDAITLDQTKFSSFAAVQAAETTVNGSTVIALGVGDTLTVSGVLPQALVMKNFV